MAIPHQQSRSCREPINLTPLRTGIDAEVNRNGGRRKCAAVAEGSHRAETGIQER